MAAGHPEPRAILSHSQGCWRPSVQQSAGSGDPRRSRTAARQPAVRAIRSDRVRRSSLPCFQAIRTATSQASRGRQPSEEAPRKAKRSQPVEGAPKQGNRGVQLLEEPLCQAGRRQHPETGTSKARRHRRPREGRPQQASRVPQLLEAAPCRASREVLETAACRGSRGGPLPEGAAGWGRGSRT
jgi:hypothetical protein